MACSAVVLAGCGGEEQQVRTTPGPRIEAAVADPLAERSANVARLLESGDRCAAATEAAQLEQEVIAAINGGEIPEIYLEDLGSVAHEIAAQVPPCAPPEDDRKEDDDGKGKGKKDKHDGDDD